MKALFFSLTVRFLFLFKIDGIKIISITIGLMLIFTQKNYVDGLAGWLDQDFGVPSPSVCLVFRILIKIYKILILNKDLTI